MNEHRFINPLVKTTSALLISSCAAHVLAQASDAPSSAEPTYQLEEVVVTAQFRDQNVQDTPIAITAVSSEMMNARAQTDISQLAKQAPSVSMQEMPGSFGPSMGASIRGVGQYDFNPALEPGVGLYVDDVYYATLTGSMFDLLDLERVEILRGPQGTLAGKNSIGGAIKLFSSKPTGDGGGYVSALVGSDNRTEFRGSTDFAVTDNMAARISGVFKSQDGYVDRVDYGCAFPDSGVAPNTAPGGDCTLSKMGEEGYHALRGLVSYDPSTSLSFLLAADYTRERHTNAAGVLLYANNQSPGVSGNGVGLDASQLCGKYCNYAITNMPAADADNWLFFLAGLPPIPAAATLSSDQISHEGWGSSLTADWQLSDNLSLKSISSYREYETAFGSGDISAATAELGRSILDHWFLSQEFRLSAQITDSTFLTVGAFYSDQRTNYFTLQDIRYIPVFPLQFIGDDPVDADTQAVFFNFGWDINEALTLNIGGRYTEESKDYTFSRRALDGSPHWNLSSLDGVVGQYEDEIVDYRAALNYRINNRLMVYASTATGYKGGGVNPRPFFAGQVQSFGPEELTAYELGVKGDFFDNRMRLNAAVFFNDYEDIQLTLLACPTSPCALPANVADADVKGFELEAMIYPTQALMIDASLSVLDFEYKNFPDAATIGTLNDVSPYNPEEKASIGIQYEFGLPSGGTLTPRLDVSYQSQMFTNATATRDPEAMGVGDIDSYTLSNFNLTWRNAQADLEATFQVSNLFDKYYFVSKFDLTNAGAGTVAGVPARGREVAFSVRKNF